MSWTIDAIYKDGVFMPLERVNIEERKKIKIILDAEPEHPLPEEGTLAGIIDIAKDCSDSDLSTHHDKYLYGALSK